MLNRKSTSEGRRMMISICGGIIIAIALSISLTAIGALCIQNEYLKMDTIRAMAYIIQFIAVFLAVLFVCKIHKSKLALVSSIVAGAYFLVQILLAMLLYGGVGGGFVISVVIILLGCLAGIALSFKGKSVQHNRKKVKHFR